jgi:hypothetical protein
MNPSKFLPPLLLALVLVGGCGGADTAAVPDTPARERRFSELYQLRKTLVPEQPDSAPIVRISGVDLGPGGVLALADVSEGNVKLFGPDGRLIRILGRKGAGPAEFGAPRYPRFAPDGLLYVGDPQSARVQSFDSTGTLAGSVSLPRVGILQGLHPLPNGNLLVLAASEERSSVLLEVDTAGRTVREFLNIGRVRPTGQKDHEVWRNINAFFLDVSGDTAYVSNSVSDSLWSVHLPTGREKRERLAMSGYIGPTPPSAMPDDISALLAWSRGFHTSSTLTAEGGAVLMPYVRGVLNHGDPMLLVTRTPSGAAVSSDAPPIIGGGDGMLIGILNPGDAEVRLGLYTRTPGP